MTVSATLDVALGLAFVFLLFALAVSKINETIATVLNLRHKGLESALVALLGNASGPGGETLSAEKVLSHELIQPIQAAAKGSFPKPVLGTFGQAKKGISYLPARTFSAVVLDLLAPAGQLDPQGNPVNDDPLQRAAAAVAQLGGNPARKPLLRMLADAQGDRDRFRQSLEHWYDDTMARVSGWYKRYVQRIILIISIVLVASLNVDSINIAQVLWRLPTERTAVAAAAAKGATGSNPSQSADQQIRDIAALKLPLGWSPPHISSAVSTDPQHVPLGLASWLIKLLGLALTVLALSFGAPFWFEALTRIGSLRQSGPKPASSAQS
jgi:hypothetical protein